MGRPGKPHPLTEEQRRRGRAMKPLVNATNERGVKYRWVAEHAGVAASSLCLYLSGRCRWPEQVFRRVCFLLKVEADEVLRLEPAEVLFQSERTERLARKRRENAKRKAETEAA